MSCGTRAQDVRPGDPDGARLLRSSLWDRSLTKRYCLLRELRYFPRRPPITAGHPVRPSAPSPSGNHSGFGTPPPHRPATAVTTAWQFISAGPHSISTTRETIATPSPNVYSSRDRFPHIFRRDCHPRSATVPCPVPATARTTTVPPGPGTAQGPRIIEAREEPHDAATRRPPCPDRHARLPPTWQPGCRGACPPPASDDLRAGAEPAAEQLARGPRW